MPEFREAKRRIFRLGKATLRFSQDDSDGAVALGASATVHQAMPAAAASPLARHRGPPGEVDTGPGVS